MSCCFKGCVSRSIFHELSIPLDEETFPVCAGHWDRVQNALDALHVPAAGFCVVKGCAQKQVNRFGRCAAHAEPYASIKHAAQLCNRLSSKAEALASEARKAEVAASLPPPAFQEVPVPTPAPNSPSPIAPAPDPTVEVASLRVQLEEARASSHRLSDLLKDAEAEIAKRGAAADAANDALSKAQRETTIAEARWKLAGEAGVHNAQRLRDISRATSFLPESHQLALSRAIHVVELERALLEALRSADLERAAGLADNLSALLRDLALATGKAPHE